MVGSIDGSHNNRIYLLVFYHFQESILWVAGNRRKVVIFLTDIIGILHPCLIHIAEGYKASIGSKLLLTESFPVDTRTTPYPNDGIPFLVFRTHLFLLILIHRWILYLANG